MSKIITYYKRWYNTSHKTELSELNAIKNWLNKILYNWYFLTESIKITFVYKYFEIKKIISQNNLKS